MLYPLKEEVIAMEDVPPKNASLEINNTSFNSKGEIAMEDIPPKK